MGQFSVLCPVISLYYSTNPNPKVLLWQRGPLHASPGQQQQQQTEVKILYCWTASYLASVVQIPTPSCYHEVNPTRGYSHRWYTSFWYPFGINTSVLEDIQSSFHWYGLISFSFSLNLILSIDVFFHEETMALCMCVMAHFLK